MKGKRYIVVASGLEGQTGCAWSVGLASDEGPFETWKDVAAFASPAEARRYAKRRNAGKPGVP